MKDTGPEVSVIVVNYNGRKWLDGCLSALRRQEGAGIEAVVVDNGSSDGSAEFVARYHPWASLLTLERNLGFAGGNNAGAAVARGRYLAFLNNDTDADPGWVASLLSALDADAGAGLATSRIVSLDDGVTLDSAGDGYLRAGGAFKRGHGQPDAAFLAPQEVFGACGAAFMIRRVVFEEIGGFDEDFFLVYEDVDLSYRAQIAGYRCLYVPGAVVRHAVSATLGRGSRMSAFYGQRNLEWVYLKNTPWPLLLRTGPSHVLYSLAGGLFMAFNRQFGTWLTAKWAALAGLPRLLRKRVLVQKSRRAEIRRLWSLMDRGWLSLKWREKRLDLLSVRAR
jgi:GT2 family glycosyltransferase